MSDQVEQVKQKIDILEIIGEKVTLKKAGRHYKGLCPFHSEKTPSFIVSPERQSYKCFGCGESGDVFSFLEKYEGMSFLESLETLAKRVGITIESYRPTVQDSRKKRLLAAMDLASEYYHFLLTKHESGEEAREYLKKRGISNEAIKQFKLGWAPNTWRNVSEFLIKKKGYKTEELEEAGMVIPSGGENFYDRFRGRVMFPLRDQRGIVVGFSGRTLSGDVKEAKYINSPETMIYSKSKMLYGLWENREYIRKENKAVLVEGELDTIPSWQAGEKAVVAIKGSAFTEEQARLIARYTKNILMALDADAAGQEAIKRAVNIAENIDMSIRVVQIEGGKDPGDVATNNPKAWREMVKGAVMYWDFLIESACKKYGTTTGEGARAISQEVVPVLATITNLVMKAHYAGILAKKLMIPEESIYEEMERVRKKKELSGLKEKVIKIEKGEVVSRREKLEKYLLAIALQSFEKVKDQLGEIEEEWFEVRAVGKVITLLKKWEGKTLEIKKFAGELPEELQSVIDETYLRDLTGVEDVKREWGRVKSEIEEFYLKAKLTQYSEEIKKMEEEKVSEEKMAKLQEEFALVSRKLSQVGK